MLKYQMMYKNHRGESHNRVIIPMYLWYGHTQYHKEDQIFLHAFDYSKDAERDFAVKDIISPNFDVMGIVKANPDDFPVKYKFKDNYFVPFMPPTFAWDPYKDVQEFHEKFDLTYDGPPRPLQGELRRFRCQFLREEIEEYVASSTITSAIIEDQELVYDELEHQLDALLDELYVVLGTAYLQGFTHQKFIEGWRRVHRANMGKVRAVVAADSKRGSTF